MVGSYDYVVDVEPMRVNSSVEERQTKMQMLGMLKDPAIVNMLAQEGKKVKISEMLISLFESGGIKDGDKYFDNLPSPVQVDGTETIGGGIGGGQEGGNPGGNGQDPRMGNDQGDVASKVATLLG